MISTENQSEVVLEHVIMEKILEDFFKNLGTVQKNVKRKIGPITSNTVQGAQKESDFQSMSAWTKYLIKMNFTQLF